MCSKIHYKRERYLPWPFFGQCEHQRSTRVDYSGGSATMVVLSLYPHSCQNQNTTGKGKVWRLAQNARIKN